MAYKYTKRKEPTLTIADRKRIAAIDNNPVLLHRKHKVGLTLKHPKIKAELYIVCYGKDKDELKASIEEHVNFFKKADKLWKLLKLAITKDDCHS